MNDATSPMAGDSTRQRLLDLADQFSQQPDFLSCVQSLQQGQSVTFDSVWGSSCALLAAALSQHVPQLVIVVDDPKSQDLVLDDLPTFFEGLTERFPAHLPGGMTAQSVDLEYGDRLRLIKSLATGDAGNLIVATVPALLQPTPSRDAIFGQSRKMTVGGQLNIEDFVQWLLENGYHQTSAVELPGEFSNRGGIIDVYATDWEGPVRIELFDDEIESLRQFDPGTQRSVEELREVEITIVNQESVADGNLFEFVSDSAVVLLVEPEKLAEAAQRFIERSPEHERLFSWEAVNQQWARLALASANQVAGGYLGTTWQLPVESVEQFSGDIGDLKIQVDRLARDATGNPSELFVLARTEGEIPRVDEILTSTSVAQDQRLHLGLGCVHSGFRIRNFNTVLVGCDQMFHRTELRRTGRRKLSKAIDSFLDLRQGDLVIHLAHGIGRFRGLKMLDKEGQLTEHLELEFYGGTKLYVPASKIDLVQKYVGGTKTRPVLAKIGGKSWAKQKANVEKAITDLAAEMIELQAQRSGRPGIAMKRDTEWQHEFE